MSSEIPHDICELLESALNDKIENFEIARHESNEKGSGFLGEIVFISVTHKKTGVTNNFAIKQVLTSTVDSTTDYFSSVYENEIKFYNEILPSFRTFQESYEGVEVFESTPKCFSISSEPGKEKLILENLKFQGYDTHPKKIPLDTKMYEAIFKLYGKYHAISYAYKHNQPEKFNKLCQGFDDTFLKMQDLMTKPIKSTCKQILYNLEEDGEHKIAEKFRDIADTSVQRFTDCLTNKSPNSVILHGDCWSNNLMFKFNDSHEIEDIKLIDFQMINLGSPVLDLSYTLYSGATKETLDNFERFLKIYHESLRHNLKQFNCDVDAILPYKTLKEEWKKYHFFGFSMALLIWMAKVIDLTDVPDLTDLMDNKATNKEEEFNPKTKTKGDANYRKVIMDLVHHIYKQGLL